jgi:hypothetical protein
LISFPKIQNFAPQLSFNPEEAIGPGAEKTPFLRRGLGVFYGLLRSEPKSWGDFIDVRS